jgi:Mg2+-importing ATPase
VPVATQTSPYWSWTGTEALAKLGSGILGLSAGEAAARIRQYGPNTVAEETEATLFKLLARQFQSPLVLILVFAAVVSLFLREWTDAAIVLVIVVGSTLLGFSQEYRASSAMAQLRKRLALTVTVVRDGRPETVPASTVVPGDVILLSAGNLVPADGLVLEAKDFLVTEASLTGESFPIEKQPGILSPDAPIGARTNAVFLGTSVRSGTATVMAVTTGRSTAFGAIASRIRAQAPETEFARGVRQFGGLLVRVMIVLVLSVLAFNQFLGRPVIESLLFAAALAVGMSPELLPVIISVTLSAGARAMARRGVIVRRLEAIENLGSMDILCTDKTGTLTEGLVVLSSAVDADGQTSAEVARLAFLNAALETGIENPLDAAIVAAGKHGGLTTDGYRKIDEIPYDFMRKRLTIVAAAEHDAATHQIVTKGAFDTVVAVCSTMRSNGSEVPLTERERGRLEGFYQRKGEEGLRVLALAIKIVDAKDHYQHEDESHMCLIGFLLFSDPPKKDIRKVISDLAALGIRIKVITGDNRHVAAHLAQVIGLDARALLTGAAIAKLRDEALWHLAERTDLFVEVDPQQKERIVRALQRTGHAVGYLGDGINDAPALHAADVGISVDQAVDIARESADIILLRPELDVLRQGVEDGRRTFANTLKYICITTSANFGNMISMALATPFLPFFPLTAKQILLNNFLSDLPSLAISTDNVDPEKLAHAQRWSVSRVRSFMVVFGLISSIFDVLTFVAIFQGFAAGEQMFQTAWFVVSLLTELAVVMVLRTERPMFKSRPSRVLVGTTVAVVAVALAIPYTGELASTFGFVPLPAPLLAALLLIVVAYLGATQAAKHWFFRRSDTIEPGSLHRRSRLAQRGGKVE